MLKHLLADTAFDVLIVLAAWNLHANDSTVTGVWHIIRDDRPETNTLALAETADAVVGAWTPPNGGPRIILEEGYRVGDTFIATFEHDKEDFALCGTMSGDYMKLEVRHGKNGRHEVIYATAIRASPHP